MIALWEAIVAQTGKITPAGYTILICFKRALTEAKRQFCFDSIHIPRKKIIKLTKLQKNFLAQPLVTLLYKIAYKFMCRIILKLAYCQGFSS